MTEAPLSRILTDLAEPLVDEFDVALDPDLYRELLLVAAAAWNASRDQGPRRPEACLEELVGDDPHAGEAGQALDGGILEKLSARAGNEHPDDPRRVSDVRVAERADGGLQVYAFSPVEEEGGHRAASLPRQTSPRAGDPLAGAREMLNLVGVSAEARGAVEEILELLTEVPDQQGVSPGHLARAGEILVLHAVADPGSVLRSRKREVWAAAALHAAPLTTFSTPADPERLTAEGAARIFRVSTASAANRSLDLRNSWETALEAGAHPRFPGAPVGLVRLATGVLDPSGGGEEDESPWTLGSGARPREILSEALADEMDRTPRDRLFELDRFADEHGLDSPDRRSLGNAAQGARDAYCREVLGKDPVGRSPAAVLERPRGFGLFLREALRSGGASEETRDALAFRTVALLARPLGEAPELALLPVARLAARGRLRGAVLEAAVALALRERRALDGIRTDELRPLWSALGTDEELTSGRRAEALAALVRAAGASRGARRGTQLLTAIAREEEIPGEVRGRMLERLVDSDPSPLRLGRVSPGVRRRAFRLRAEMGDEPWREAARLAEEGRAEEDADRWRAAAEVLGMHGAGAPSEEIRALVRAGLEAPAAATRQAWYRAGVKLIGGDVREWAPDDVLQRAKSRERRGESGTGGDPAQTSLL